MAALASWEEAWEAVPSDDDDDEEGSNTDDDDDDDDKGEASPPCCPGDDWSVSPRNCFSEDYDMDEKNRGLRLQLMGEEALPESVGGAAGGAGGFMDVARQYEQVGGGGGPGGASSARNAYARREDGGEGRVPKWMK